MKKIKHIKNLRAKQKQLQQREGELETAIHNDWNGLKESLRPSSMVGNSLSKWVDKNAVGRSLVTSGLSWGAALLATKIIKTAVKLLK